MRKLTGHVDPKSFWTDVMPSMLFEALVEMNHPVVNAVFTKRMPESCLPVIINDKQLWPRTVDPETVDYPKRVH